MTEDQLVRGRQLVKRYLTIGLLLLGYLLLHLYAGVDVPCPFKSLTGYFCPGCGLTTMCLSLVALDIPAAFAANPALFIALPFLLGHVIRQDWRQMKSGASFTAGSAVMPVFWLLYFIIFTIARNFAG